MKKAGILFVFIVVMVLATACGDTSQTDTTSSVRETFKTADELISEAEEREQQEKSSVPSQEQMALEGRFVCTMKYVDEAFFPVLELNGEGKAVFTANLLNAMGEIHADFTVSDTAVKLAVTDVGFDGFSADNITEIVFNLISENELELAYVTPDTALGATQPGDRFIRKE